MGGPDPEKSSRTKFAKRCKTLRTKAHELAKLCDANVYLLIDHPRGSYAYNSVDDRSWPPPDEVLVSMSKATEGSIKLKKIRNFTTPIYAGKALARWNPR